VLSALSRFENVATEGKFSYNQSAEKPMRKFSKFAIAVSISLATFAASANAVVVLSESFSYPDGPLVGAAGSPWTTNSGTTMQQNVVGGRLFIDDNETEDTVAFLSSAATAGSITATFDLQMDPADIVTSAAGDYITHFVGGNNGFVGRVFMLTDPASTGTTFRIGLSTGAAAPNAIFTSVFTTGTTYSISLTYDFTTNVATLTSAGFGSITSTDVVDNNNITRYGFRQTTNTGDVFFDNLIIDAAIPEPATYAMLFVGAALLFGMQHLRRKMS
jgi:hypothetical protein